MLTGDMTSSQGNKCLVSLQFSLLCMYFFSLVQTLFEVTLKNQPEIVALKEKIFKIQRRGKKHINCFALASYSDQLCKVRVFKQTSKQTKKPVLCNFPLCPKDITKHFKDTPTLLAPSCQSGVNHTPILDILKHHLKQNNFLALRQGWEVCTLVIAPWNAG